MTISSGNDGTISVGDRVIGPGHPCFIIAEIGANHDGLLEQGKALIDAAAEAGADAVKFQSIAADKIFAPEWASLETYETVKQTELPEEWYGALAAHAKERGVLFFSTPTYPESVDLLEQVGVPMYKIASPQAAGAPHIVRRMAATHKPLLISTGLADYGRIADVVKICAEEGNERLVLLHCVSKYPTLPDQANLRAMAALQAMFGYPVGFSDHTEGISVPLAAAALGARALEKHITLDKSLPGPDHGFAVEPPEFAQMVRGVRDVEASLGTGVRLALDPDETLAAERVQTRLVVRNAVSAGDIIDERDLLFLRASQGVTIWNLDGVRGAAALQNIPAGTPLTWDMLRLRQDP
jgi:N,N'-diacetyllegionaminate synthase